MSDTQLVNAPQVAAPVTLVVAPDPDAITLRPGMTDDQWLDRFEPSIASEIVPQPALAAPTETTQEQLRENSPAVDSQDAGGAQQETAADYETARNALRRDGITTAVLEKMTQQEVLDLGLRRAKNHTDVDAAFKDLKDLRAKQDSPAKPAETPTPSVSKVDLAAVIKPFADLLGDEAAPHLEAFAKAILQANAEEAEGLRQEIKAARTGQVEVVLERSREKLQERFPGLQDDAKFETVVRKMTQIDPSLSLHERMRDAAAIVFFDEIKQASAADRSHAARQKIAAQPTTQSSVQPPRAMTPDEQADYALTNLEKGTDWRTVRRNLTG